VARYGLLARVMVFSFCCSLFFLSASMKKTSYLFLSSKCLAR